jgi:hypothetical protein
MSFVNIVPKHLGLNLFFKYPVLSFIPVTTQERVLGFLSVISVLALISFR